MTSIVPAVVSVTVSGVVVFVVVLKHGVAKVVGEIAIHAVNVVGIVLSVVIFDEESWALDQIVVRLARL